MTESDVLAFSGLTGDFNLLHVDEEFARTSPFGTRVPHGPLIHDIYLGLLDRLGLVAGAALAFLELRWKFLAPVLVGATSARFNWHGELIRTVLGQPGVNSMLF